MHLSRKVLLVWVLTILVLLKIGPAYAETLPITAASAVVIEAKTGKIVYDKNSEEKRAPASTTKIMTALLTLEKKENNLNELAVASEKAATVGESSIWLVKGEKLKIEDLLYGLMLNSGNDAAVTLAENVGGSQEGFVNMMNEKAREIGAVHTHFANPNGLPNDNHYTTAHDLAMITRYALKNPKFAEIVSTKTKVIPWPGHEWDRHLINTNKLLWQLEGANGVKTGYTNKAGHCLVSSATRNGQQFICVILGSTNALEDSKALLEYAFANFERVNIFRAGEKVGEVPVKQGMEAKVELKSAQDVDVVVPKWEKKNIEKKALLKEDLVAPIKKNQVVGQSKIFLGKQELASGDLLADRDIHPKTLLRSFIKEFWGLFALMIKSFA